jgi:hypothetical protein
MTDKRPTGTLTAFSNQIQNIFAFKSLHRYALTLAREAFLPAMQWQRKGVIYYLNLALTGIPGRRRPMTASSLDLATADLPKLNSRFTHLSHTASRHAP